MADGENCENTSDEANERTISSSRSHGMGVVNMVRTVWLCEMTIMAVHIGLASYRDIPLLHFFYASFHFSLAKYLDRAFNLPSPRPC